MQGAVSRPFLTNNQSCLNPLSRTINNMVICRAPSVLAGGLTTPIPGPSEHTKDELKALQTFADTKSPSLPHLLAWKTAVQGDDGPMPNGYIAYIVMTLMPGRDLMDLKFWSMPAPRQEEIRRAFIVALKCVCRWQGTSNFPKLTGSTGRYGDWG